jgi:molybdopterin converting factor small subunit
LRIFPTRSIQPSEVAGSLKVTVEYLGSIAGLVDGGCLWEVEIGEKAVLSNLLTDLATRQGEAFRRSVFEVTDKGLKPKCVITINGRLISELNGIYSNLQTGDKVVLMQIVSAG